MNELYLIYKFLCSRFLIFGLIFIQFFLPFSSSYYVVAAEITGPSPFSADRPVGSRSESNAQETDLSFLTTAAQNLSATGSSGAASSAQRMAVGYTASSVQEWLSHFGTARVKVNIDDNGKWDDSAIDFLAPLYDNQKSMLFTQLGVRAPDGRVTGNVGMGVRTFASVDWMFGGNVFFDDDFTGKNRRVGIGGEAWSNFIKLSANTYIGTTDWHNSRDFDDYNEKPADGYDVRFEGYLPVYPQLGSKVVWEQYYGDNVALFDKDHLQSNPSAITMGLSYTPVPLFTAGIDYKRGQDSLSDTQFSLNLRYTLGQPWEKQISPDNIRQLRSLEGSRYDPVERNNEIVLQYKKKDSTDALAEITLVTQVDSSPADGKTANVVVLKATTAKGAPAQNAQINWEASGSGVLSASSSLTDSNGMTSVNVTNKSAEQVTVTATSGSVSRTTNTSFMPWAESINLQLVKNNSQANGVDENSGSITVVDANGQPMADKAVTWKVNNNAVITRSDAVTNSQGKAEIHFSSQTAGTVQLSASAAGITKTVDSVFVAQSTSAVNVTMTTNNMQADGTSANVARALVNDAQGNPMAGVNVVWSLSSATAGPATPLTVMTNAQGIATLNLTDTVAENVTVTATSGGQSGSTSAVFVAVAVSQVAVTITTNNMQADGRSANVAQARVTDAAGNPMSGVNVTWTMGSSTAANTTPLTVMTNSSGVAMLNLTDTVAQSVTVTAGAGGQSGTAQAVFTAVPAPIGAVTVTYPGVPGTINVNAVRGGLDINVAYPGIAAGDVVKVHFVMTGQADSSSTTQILPTHDFTYTVTSADTGGSLTFTVPENEVMGFQPLNGVQGNLKADTSAVVTRPSTSETETGNAPTKNVDTLA